MALAFAVSGGSARNVESRSCANARRCRARSRSLALMGCELLKVLEQTTHPASSAAALRLALICLPTKWVIGVLERNDVRLDAGSEEVELERAVGERSPFATGHSMTG